MRRLLKQNLPSLTWFKHRFLYVLSKQVISLPKVQHDCQNKTSVSASKHSLLCNIINFPTGCGSNRFGAKCQHKCVEDEQPDGCKAKMFCLPDPYGCTCATGYEGLICTLSKSMYIYTCLYNVHGTLLLSQPLAASDCPNSWDFNKTSNTNYIISCSCL